MRTGTLCLFAVLFALVIVVVIFSWGFAHNAMLRSTRLSRQAPQHQPTTQVDRPTPSLLFMVASYSFEQFIALQNVLDNVRDICNSGWDVTVHLQVSSKGLVASHAQLRLLRERMFCIRTNSYIPLIVEEHGMVGFGLNSKHRSYAAAHVMDFDYFCYAEEDMLLTVSNLLAYVSATERLKQALPATWLRYQIGFLRYEDSVVGTTERVTWEYMPHQVHVVDLGPELGLELGQGLGQRLGKYIFTNNLNQAIYIFAREQLLDLEDRCEFLGKPGKNAFYGELRRAQNQDWKYMSVGVSEWSSSFQQVLQCGLRRIIPAEHFQLFMIHHGTDKAQTRRLRRELLTMQNWTDLVAAKSRSPVTMQQAQFSILPEQYNLHLMDLEKIRGKVKWSWD